MAWVGVEPPDDETFGGAGSKWDKAWNGVLRLSNVLMEGGGSKIGTIAAGEF